ncbi:MAG TPA: DUF1015 domain-containing protein [bacterium (Candidatus Stahlbacteria)]|nr:DUF1015 domain-containing protein [Candidatus Stahlbacteria bacterium]
MPEIRPFLAVRFDPAKVGDLSKVVTQPYDKIDPKLQEEYYARSPYNFVRLILGKIEATDDDQNNRYTRARETYKQWLEQGVLIRDEKPAIYPYHQEFSIGKETYLRRGFITILKVEEFGGKILPHERTLSKPKEDRFKLFMTTRKNFETVFMLYTDPEKKVLSALDPKGSAPLFDVKDDYGYSHRLWKVTDPDTISTVQEVFKGSTLLIADGHHRYETSLTLSKEIGGDGPHNYRMVTFVNLEDSGLVILPTHRLICNLERFDTGLILRELEKYFEVTEIERTEIAGHPGAKHQFIMITKDKACRLKLKDPQVLDSIIPDRAIGYRRLDVTILHTLIIERILKIPPEKIEDHVRYAREIEKAEAAVDSGEFQIAFLLAPTSANEVKDVALAGERMPQKSTDFYPKMISGLLIYDLEV